VVKNSQRQREVERHIVRYKQKGQNEKWREVTHSEVRVEGRSDTYGEDGKDTAHSYESNRARPTGGRRPSRGIQWACHCHCHVGGGLESNWVRSGLRPPIGLLCQPRVIMTTEKLVEWWLARETEVHSPSAALSNTNPTLSARTRTRAAAVGSQRLTAWGTAHPLENRIA
jgi:hypothetical protein